MRSYLAVQDDIVLCSVKIALCGKAHGTRSIDKVEGWNPYFKGLAHEIDAQIDDVNIAGIRGEWVVSPKSNPKRRVLYVHGGAYAFEEVRGFVVKHLERIPVR